MERKAAFKDKVDKLIEELELHKCDYLKKPGCKEAIREVVREYMDDKKKIGMVLDRYCTTIRLKPGAMPIKQKLRPIHQ